MTQKTLPATKTSFSNFHKHPGRLSAILTFYFLFLSEWGVYYYTLYKEFSDYIFGDFPDKTSFYIKVIAESGIFIIYTYVAYKMAKVMFGNNSSFTEKTAALMNSLCCLVFWSFLSELLYSALGILFIWTNIIFWTLSTESIPAINFWLTEIKLYYIFWTGLRNCFFCLKAEQNRNILYKTSLKEEKMKDKIIAYGKEYIDNFKQNPLSATAILTMQIIFILGWGTFYMFLCERYIKYIIPGRTYTKSAIYPEAFSLTVIAFVFLFFICKSFKTLFLNNNLLKPKLIILALSLLCAISAYPLQLLLIEAVSFLPQTSVAFWANWQILKLPIQ